MSLPEGPAHGRAGCALMLIAYQVPSGIRSRFPGMTGWKPHKLPIKRELVGDQFQQGSVRLPVGGHDKPARTGVQRLTL